MDFVREEKSQTKPKRETLESKTQEFDIIWEFYQDKTILTRDNLKIIYDNIMKVKNIYGTTAEIGVYKGYTSKMIAQITKKTHYCYDTFVGEAEPKRETLETTKELKEFVCIPELIIESYLNPICKGEVDDSLSTSTQDNLPLNYLYSSSLEEVVKNINCKNVIYRKGIFPNTFRENNQSFSFVYSDTANYEGAKESFNKFSPTIVSGGKILFYVDKNTKGVQKALDEICRRGGVEDEAETRNSQTCRGDYEGIERVLEQHGLEFVGEVESQTKEFYVEKLHDIYIFTKK